MHHCICSMGAPQNKNPFLVFFAFLILGHIQNWEPEPLFGSPSGKLSALHCFGYIVMKFKMD